MGKRRFLKGICSDVEVMLGRLRSNMALLQRRIDTLRVDNRRLEAELSRLRDENHKLGTGSGKGSGSVDVITSEYNGKEEEVRKSIDALVSIVDDCIGYWSL